MPQTCNNPNIIERQNIQRSKSDDQTLKIRRDTLCTRHGTQMKKNHIKTCQHVGMIMRRCLHNTPSKLSLITNKLCSI